MGEQTLNVQVNIPSDYVLITKIEYENLKTEQRKAQYLTMKDLIELTNRKRGWLMENLLNNPKWFDELEEFTHFPQASGDAWLFRKNGLIEFLENRFLEVLRKE